MSKFDQLLQLLDAQVSHLQEEASVLRQMACCVRQGDSETLGQLLCRQAELDADGKSLGRSITIQREQLARTIGMPLDHVTLGRLAESLDGVDALALADRRERLLEAVQQVQSESANVDRVVRFAMDFNRQLLLAVTGSADSAPTYSAQGVTSRSSAVTTFQHTV